MLADHAARVFASGAGLGPEARRACGDADRKLGLVGDILAHEIGERNFGGWDEPTLPFHGLRIVAAHRYYINFRIPLNVGTRPYNYGFSRFHSRVVFTPIKQ